MRIMAIAFAAALVVAGYLAYRPVDSGISLDHARAQVRYLRDQTAVAIDLANQGWQGRGEREIAEAANEISARRQVVTKREGQALLIGEVRIEVADNKVVSVSYSGNREDE